MVPDALSEVIDEMTDFIDQEQEVDLDTIEKWRDKIRQANEDGYSTTNVETLVLNANNVVLRVENLAEEAVEALGEPA